MAGYQSEEAHTLRVEARLPSALRCGRRRYILAPQGDWACVVIWASLLSQVAARLNALTSSVSNTTRDYCSVPVSIQNVINETPELMKSYNISRESYLW